MLRRSAGPRAKYDEGIVRVMESHYFIWGGKWSYFDILHFEYRR
ncbi:MAG: M15 family metallopeptidase [Christensenellales bacterium]